MKSIPLFFLPVLCLSLHAADPTVHLAAVQAVFDEGKDDFDGFKTLNSSEGYNVVFIVRSPDKQIVGFDDDEAPVTIGGAKANCRFFGNQAFSEGRLALRIEFTSEGGVEVSPEGTLAVKGELPVTLATGKEETRSEPFTVAEGTKVVFPAGEEGMPELEVKSFGKPKWGDDPLQIEFSTNRKPDEFAGIKFYDKDGREVESDRGSSSWMSFMGKGSGTVAYTFKAEHKEVILAVEAWTGQEEKKLPVDLKVGLAKP